MESEPFWEEEEEKVEEEKIDVNELMEELWEAVRVMQGEVSLMKYEIQFFDGYKPVPPKTQLQINELFKKTRTKIVPRSISASGDGCPICGHYTFGCRPTLEFPDKKIIYGIFCESKRRFYEQGKVPVPEHLKKYF